MNTFLAITIFISPIVLGLILLVILNTKNRNKKDQSSVLSKINRES